MKKSTKKKLIIIGIILAVLIAAGVCAFVIVDRMMADKSFDVLTDTISGGDIQTIAADVDTEGMDEETAAFVALLAKMTPEKAERMKSEVDDSDKYAIYDLLKSKLMDKWDVILGMVMDGNISPEEVSEIKTILRERLTQEDIKTIYSYYKKYEYVLNEP